MPTRRNAKRKTLTESVESIEHRKRRLEAHALRRQIRANKQVAALARNLRQSVISAKRGLRTIWTVLEETCGADARMAEDNVAMLDRLDHRVAVLEDAVMSRVVLETSDPGTR